MLLPSLALYIHIPWCIEKCPYCDFNSHAVRGELPEQEYLAALLEDLQSETGFAQGRTISSIFIGGGTPSLFKAESYQFLLDEIDKLIPIAAGAEITLEANPGTFEQHRFQGFKRAGINRLSLGIQSFNQQQLTALGRIHNRQEALHAARFARELFDNINLDLMHGLPQQNIEQACADLQLAIDIQPDHLSWYQLTIEPNTEFYSRPPNLPVDETLWAIQEQGQELLVDNGYQQYEISAYCRPDKQARHNLNYWQFGDYIGIGAGAHGKLTLAAEDKIIRRWKQKQPKRYLDIETRLSGEEQIAHDELPFEFMLNALRLTDGVKSSLFQERTGLPVEVIAQQLISARAKGLLIENKDRLQPSRQGRLFLNDLLAMFLD